MLLLLLHSLNQMSIISIFIGFQMKQFVHSVEMSVPPVDIMHLWGHPSPGVYSLPQAESAVVTHWLTVYMSLMEIHAMCTGDIYSVHKKKFQHQFFIPVQETPHPLPLSLLAPPVWIINNNKKEKSFSWTWTELVQVSTGLLSSIKGLFLLANLGFMWQKLVRFHFFILHFPCWYWSRFL